LQTKKPANIHITVSGIIRFVWHMQIIDCTDMGIWAVANIILLVLYAKVQELGTSASTYKDNCMSSELQLSRGDLVGRREGGGRK
jgi:hypothetical protein